MNLSNMFAGAPKPQIIRKVVTVPAKPKPKSKSKSASQHSQQQTKAPQAASSGVNRQPHHGATSPSPKSKPPEARYVRTGGISKNQSNGHLTPPPSAAAMAKRSNKRKAPSPARVIFPEFDDSSEESEGSVATPPVKRARHDILVPDLKRQVRDVQESADEARNVGDSIIHGADLTWEKSKEFESAFVLAEGEQIPIVALRYPSKSSPERFELVLPLETEGYEPIADIEESILQICHNYFPAPQSEELCDDLNGFKRRLQRLRTKNDYKAYHKLISELNALIQTSLSDGTIYKHLDTLHSLPLSLVERIINQTYSRTISPSVHLLKHYENGTDNVYGELLPRFAHDIFHETGLKSNHVFVDLGSGVGNVVLQAALEVGCESWGIEQMANPANLAAKQHDEFVARVKRWGLGAGKVTLIQGDFLSSPEIDATLKRADVVLVNNQAFTPSLNDALLWKFLDLKEGARIVSLKSFVPDKWEIKSRTLSDVRNLLRVKRMFFGSGSVSWTDEGGDWFVQTKDSSRLKRFQDRETGTPESVGSR